MADHHISRKELKHDKIKETLEHGAEAVISHGQFAGILVAVVLAVAIGYGGWHFYIDRQTAQASLAFDQAMKAYQGRIGPPNPAIQPDPDTWIDRFDSLPLLAQPGERWFYNSGMHVLTVLLARAAGTSFPDVLRTRILDPLGMRDTDFHAAPRNPNYGCRSCAESRASAR